MPAADRICLNNSPGGIERKQIPKVLRWGCRFNE